MDLAFSEQDLAFRDEVRAFIKEAFTEDLQREMGRSKNNYMNKDAHILWQKRLFEKGWAAPNWPTEHGGAGFTPTQKFIFSRELDTAGAPHTIPFGLVMVAPVIMAFGSDEQKKRFLPDILATNVWWCQGYSEPGSGSDLASLQMKAEDKGDHYLCNGSKIWTSMAQHADWIFCLVRTAKTEKPQQGISFLLIDMNAPGVRVEPIITLDASRNNQQEVNQVFFEDVKVPKENLVGEENKGWTYAKYLLEFERGNPYSSGLMRGLEQIKALAAEIMADGAPLSTDADFIRQATELETRIVVMEATELRIFSEVSAGQNIGPGSSSMLKTRGTELQQDISQLGVEVIGNYGFPFVEDTLASANQADIGMDGAPTIVPGYLNRRKATIYAGSNEIQHSIIAKAVLGL
ncbi:MAG: pimeloyl-CoA dehydrogenase large subunit [Alphaproteobacteria bacterium]|nr:pimeloyl-CoA dehydrogenase large subunit [Alphaproteobacteria bacterium]MBE8220041.1 pimeloyl-CoA dehydrogenase large subunit [Alphaproteobacteria bacterium]